MDDQTIQPEPEDPELQIVLIGRSKSGKSATGNTILGRKAFESFISNSSVTKKCKIEKGDLEDQNLAVVDTPGLFGSKTSDPFVKEIPEKVLEEAEKLIVSPGSVVFLVILQLGEFTEPERQTVKIIQRSFGREAAHYTMALFTRGDALMRDGRSVEEVIGADPALRDFIRECRGGYHVFDNGETDSLQVTELLEKISSMVQRNGGSRKIMPDCDETDLQGDVFQRKEESGKVNTALMTSCLDGALGGALTLSVLREFGKRVIKPRKFNLKTVLVGGMIGALAGAVRFMVCTLIKRK